MKKVCTILLVDDDQDYKYFFCKALEKVDEDIHVLTAADGVEAIEKCRQHHPDIIVVDYNMPHMNGQVFVKSLKQEYAGLMPRVVVYSTFMNMVDEKDLLALGASEVYTKPGTFNDTVEMIRTILEQGGTKRCA